MLNRSVMNDSKFVSQYMTLNGTRAGQEDRKVKTKKRIIPIAEKSRVISKGQNIADKLDMRRNAKIKGKSASGMALNKLGQKHKKINTKKVPGLALTKKQKKQQQRVLKREAVRASMIEDDDDSDDEEEEVEDVNIGALVDNYAEVKDDN